MIRNFYVLICCGFLLFSSKTIAQESRLVDLHFQIYDQGICLPLQVSPYYSTSQFQATKRVFASAAHYSTLHVFVNSADSADLNPQVNHKTQSSALSLKSLQTYDLVVLRQKGYNTNEIDSMVIKIASLDSNAQLLIPFQKGTFDLDEMSGFNTFKSDRIPSFSTYEGKDATKLLKLDSTAYYNNGRIKAKFYEYAEHYPLYYVQEFDSIQEESYAQGFHLLSNYNGPVISVNHSVWTNNDNTKYGYWECFEKGKRKKHEFWASVPYEKYEWYASGELKSETTIGNYGQGMKYAQYLENGLIKEEFHTHSQTNIGAIKSYAYSSKGELVMISTYKSSNGITKQELIERSLFYPSGQLKLEEQLGTSYSIKHYNEDGTEKIK